MFVSIVIPCYYSQQTIRPLVEMCLEEFQKNPGYECEFVLVNDGSTDGTFEEIKKLAADYPNICGVNLMRNFGQHNALMCALHYTQGDLVMGMDDDMQTHPSQMFKLIHKIEEGYDLVYGEYTKRKNTKLKNLTSYINKVTSRIMLGRPKDIVSSNFWIITRAVAEEVMKYDSFNPYIDGIFYRVTHNMANVPIEHFRREVGSSGYTFKSLLSLWLRYWNFSQIPLQISFFLGTFAAVIGLFVALWAIVHKLLDPTVPMGWSSTVAIMSLFFGVVFMVLGVIGEYLGKIILILNNTPQFIVRNTVASGKALSSMRHETVCASAGSSVREETPEGKESSH